MRTVFCRLVIWLGLFTALCLGQVRAQQRDDACANQIPPSSLAASGNETPPMAYCFRDIGKLRVIWLHGGVGQGSAKNVLTGLSQWSRYDEVWLNSPGGLVQEAITIGRSLRRFNAHVRVPKSGGVICVSACTILAMGGYNRTIDDGATFIVHAPSSMNSISGADAFHWNSKYSWDAALAELRKEPALIGRFAQNTSEQVAEASAELISYYQAMLEGTPAVSAYHRLAAAAVPQVYGATGSLRRFNVDVDDVAARGLVALQEIFTQVELAAMGRIHDALWAQRTVLGRGAEEALKIFRAGLNCRIQDLCPLERHQLEHLGYHNFSPQ